MKETWRFDLTDIDILWLKKCESMWWKNQSFEVRTLRASLYPEVPANYNPRQIPNDLIVWGARISLLGILQLDENSEHYSKCESLLLFVKDSIISDSMLEQLTGDQIEEELGFDKVYQKQLFELTNHLGAFRHGMSVNGEGQLTSINLWSDETYEEYLSFSSLEEVIDRQIEKSNRDENEDEDYSYSPFADGDDAGIPVNHPYFRSVVAQVDPKLCFVLMPFTETWSDPLWKTIKAIIEGMGIQCLRADSLTGPIIMEDIWVKINQSGFVIADMTNKNPNVMYEVGLVHALGKPSVLITQDLSTIPFDFRHLRHFEYQNEILGIENLQEMLPKIIAGIYRENYPSLISES